MPFFGWIPVSSPGLPLDPHPIFEDSVKKLRNLGTLDKSGCCKIDHSNPADFIKFVSDLISEHYPLNKNDSKKLRAAKKEYASETANFLIDEIKNSFKDYSHCIIREVKSDKTSSKKKSLYLIFGDYTQYASAFSPKYAVFVDFSENITVRENSLGKIIERRCGPPIERRLTFDINIFFKNGLVEIIPNTNEFRQCIPCRESTGNNIGHKQTTAIVQEVFCHVKEIYHSHVFHNGGHDGPDSLICCVERSCVSEAIEEFYTLYKRKVARYKDIMPHYAEKKSPLTFLDLLKQAKGEMYYAMNFVSLFSPNLHRFEQKNGNFKHEELERFKAALDSMEKFHSAFMSSKSIEHTISMRWSAVLIMFLTIFTLGAINIQSLRILFIFGIFIGLLSLVYVNLKSVIIRWARGLKYRLNIKWTEFWGYNPFKVSEADDYPPFPISCNILVKLKKKLKHN